MLKIYLSARTRLLFSALFFSAFFASSTFSQAPCVCTNCPQFMPDNFTGNFLINVMNAANPTLGQNGQGVCGVTLNFDHEWVGDLSITLTSPAGQTVTLVGPIGLFGMTDGSAWNVTFLPCADPVSPDPGFSDTWSNNQAWGLGGSYSGSYYPSSGCLENFNSGPVNGTWTLTVVDGQQNDVGNFYNYEIIFCDPTGIDCFSCAANAGNLLQPDVTACEGSTLLDLDLPPTYTAQSPAPPATEYAYTYVIGGAGGVILDYDPNADLSGYAPGTYTVCGMSYLAVQEPSIPAPNGVLTITQLRTLLNSGTAPFCGKVTVNCVNVTINMSPPDEEAFEEICFPGCVFFHGANYCQTGDYTVTLTQNGCPYSATLHLVVKQPTTAFITEQVCEGGCSVNPNFPTACAPGVHTEKITNVAGCDSTITLNLTVLNATANIANNPVIPCTGGNVQILGTGSSVGGFTYQWTATNGGNIVGPSNAINVSVNAPGDYQLKVCRTTSLISCCDSASVTIDADTNLPNTPSIISGANSLCLGQTQNYFTSPVPGATSYTWTVPPGVTVNSGSAGLLTNITWGANAAGQICVAANNGCGASDTLCQTINVNTAPLLTAITGPDSVCGNAVAVYTIGASANTSTISWTVTAPVQIVSGQGTNAIEVNWNGASSATICAVAANNCGNSQQLCKNIIVNYIPSSPAIAGSMASCTGASGVYTLTPVPGATSYVWSVNGGSISGVNNTEAVSVVWGNVAGPGTVCARAINACGASPQTCINVVLGTPPPAPVISGPAMVCAGDTAIYEINPVAGATGYHWTVPVGATIINGQNSTAIKVIWQFAPGGNIGVSADGACGAAPVVNFPVIVNAVIFANAGPDQTICGLIDTLTGNVSGGQWTLVTGPGMASFSNASAMSTPVNVTQPGMYTFRYTLNNANCISNSETDIVFNSVPVAGANINTCNNTNEYYTVTFPIIGGIGPFNINNGAIINGGFVSDSILSGQAYNFQIIDSNGCQSPTIQGVFNCNCSTNAGTMSATPLAACKDATVTAVVAVPPVFDANDAGIFVLHEGAGISIVNPIAENTTGEFGVLPGINFGQTYYISFVVGNNLNGAPDLQDPCLSVNQGQPVVFYDFPVSNAGTNQSVCGLQANLGASGSGIWSIVNAPGGANLQWSNVNATNATLTASMEGLFTLAWTVTENGCTATDQVDVIFNEYPVISTVSRDCDPANQFFIVTIDISSGTAPYTVNGSPISGSTFSSGLLANNTSYNYLVADANGCTAPEVSGAYACNCSTNAGTMDLSPLSACVGTTVQAIANPDASLDGNDVAAYVLHNGSATTLGTVFDENTTGIFGLVGSMVTGQTYYISRVVGNPAPGSGFPLATDPCFSFAPGQPVVFHEIPVPVAGEDIKLCGYSATLNATASIFGGVWSVVSGAGNTTFAQNNLTNTPVIVDQAGEYTFQWTEINQGCIGSDEVIITFNELPTAAITSEICNNTNTQYQITMAISGGTGPFTIAGLGGTFSGIDFTSEPIPNNTSYSLSITDANGCTFGPVEGIKNCNCQTDAGTMGLITSVFCAGSPAIATWNNDAQLDGDDIVAFVLHTSSGSTLGTILAVSASPQFDFSSNYTIGQIYYISAIAGSNTGGVIDLNDPCFSVASGTPVKWKPHPQGTMTGDTAICFGEQATLTFSGQGEYPLIFRWQDAAGMVSTALVTGNSPVNISVSPAQTTVFDLFQITDGSLPTCSLDTQLSVTVVVNQPVSAGTAPLEIDICAEDEAIVDLSSLLVDADPGGAWLEVSFSPALPGTFDPATGIFIATGQQPGTYLFRYKLDAIEPCPDDETVVTVNIRPQPKSDAGPDQEIDCNTSVVQLGGMATSTGNGILYSWEENGMVIPMANNFTYTTSAGGVYVLKVENSYGCVGTDDVIVSLNNALPQFGPINAKDIGCNGMRDGFISIDTVYNGTEPYLFSLNGGSFSERRNFGPLGPGVYTIEVLDANGCTTLSDEIEIIEPPQLRVDLGTDLNIRLGDTISLEAAINVSVGQIDTVIWTPLFDTSGTGTVYQHFLPKRTTTLDVFVRDTSGCFDNDRIDVFVDTRRHIYVPNIFEPSGSGINVVTVYGGNDVANIEYFRIFDRWGELMHNATGFEPNDEAMGWGGNFNGKAALPGVYVWTAMITFKDGATELFSGDVMILR